MPSASLTVNFASGSDELTPSAMRELDRLGRALTSQELAPFRFRIEGHTDTVGPASLNQALSERRAAAVGRYLEQRFGVNPARLETIGLGQTQLVVPTPDQTPNAQNRRVQVINLGR
jgi:outer membrane protein OmpA-like peptidoglycan-associated protein